jgi:hypothetical protein
MIKFCNYLVCTLKALKEVILIFLMQGHSATLQDQHNVETTSNYYGMQGMDWVITPSDIERVANSRKSKVTCYSSYYDWKESFSKCELPSIPHFHLSRYHLFKFTCDGFYYKEYMNDEWVGPHFMEHNFPSIPPRFGEIPNLDDTVMKHVSEYLLTYRSQLPPESIEYLQNILKNEIGFDNKPSFELLSGMQDGCGSDVKLHPLPVAHNTKTSSDINSKGPNQGEELVDRILSHRVKRNPSGDFYEFEVQWGKGATDTTTWVKLNDLRDTLGKDSVDNIMFVDYQLMHPRINFLAIPPQQRKTKKAKTGK